MNETVSENVSASSCTELTEPAGGSCLHRKAFWTLLIVTIVLFMGRLWEGGLSEDPAQYAANAKEIVLSGDWLTMRTMGDPYFNKPPLYFWMSAVLFKIFGIGCYAARFWSAALSAGCVFLIYDIVRRFRGKDEALLAGIALASSNEFLRNGVSGRLDTPLTFFFLLALWSVLAVVSGSNRKWLVLMGVAVGLAGLTKGTIAVLGLFMLLLGIAIGARRLLLSGWLWLGLLLGIGACVGWHLAVAAANPNFWDIYFGREVATRIKGGGAWKAGTPKLAFSMKFLFGRGMPWSLLGLIGLFFSPSLLRDKKTRPYMVMWLCWLGVLLYAALVSNKLYFRYFIPMYPTAAALSAFVILKFLPKNWWLKFKQALPTIGGAVVLAVVLLPIPRHSDSNADLDALNPTIQTLLPKGKTLYAYRVDSSVIHQFYGTVSFYCNRKAIRTSDFAKIEEARPVLVLCLSEEADSQRQLKEIGYELVVEHGELMLFHRISTPAENADGSVQSPEADDDPNAAALDPDRYE